MYHTKTGKPPSTLSGEQSRLNSIHSLSRAFEDERGRIHMTFHSCPPDMLDVNQAFIEVMEDTQSKLKFGGSTNAKDSKRKPPRRGDFPTVAAGISFGGGQTVVCDFYSLLSILTCDVRNHAHFDTMMKMKK